MQRQVSVEAGKLALISGGDDKARRQGSRGHLGQRPYETQAESESYMSEQIRGRRWSFFSCWGRVVGSVYYFKNNCWGEETVGADSRAVAAAQARLDLDSQPWPPSRGGGGGGEQQKHCEGRLAQFAKDGIEYKKQRESMLETFKLLISGWLANRKDCYWPEVGECSLVNLSVLRHAPNISAQTGMHSAKVIPKA